MNALCFWVLIFVPVSLVSLKKENVSNDDIYNFAVLKTHLNTINYLYPGVFETLFNRKAFAGK